MKLMSKSLTVPVFLAVFVASIAAVSVPQYRFLNPGNYPGAFETFPNGVSSTEISGYYLQPGGGTYGYLQTSKGFVTAQPVGSASSYLGGINLSGLAVGGFCQGSHCDGAPFAAHGYTYDSTTGSTTTIDYPGAMFTAAYGISSAGQIVGGFCPTDPVCPRDLFYVARHGFLDNNGVFTQLGFPGSEGTTAFGINKAGTIIGEYETRLLNHSFIYQNGVYTDLNYPGANWTIATGINDLGVVVGHYQDTLGNENGFMYCKGQWAQIFVKPGYPGLMGGINNANDLVGNWFNSSGAVPFLAVTKP